MFVKFFMSCARSDDQSLEKRLPRSCLVQYVFVIWSKAFALFLLSESSFSKQILVLRNNHFCLNFIISPKLSINFVIIYVAALSSLSFLHWFFQTFPFFVNCVILLLSLLFPVRLHFLFISLESHFVFILVRQLR